MTHQQSSDGPGWAPRILFWAALVIGPLPQLVMAPMLIVRSQPKLFDLFSLVSLVAGILELILGVIALLLVAASPVRMRLFGMGLFVLSSVYALIVPHLISMVMNRIVIDFTLAMSFQSIIWTFHSGVVLAGTLIAWNLARNRTWPVHLGAAGFAMVTALIVAFVEWAMNSLGSSFVTSMVLTQLVLLGLTFGSLGLLHVSGRLVTRSYECRMGHLASSPPVATGEFEGRWPSR